MINEHLHSLVQKQNHNHLHYHYQQKQLRRRHHDIEFQKTKFQTSTFRKDAVSKELSIILRNWDKGNSKTRRNILTRFISEHRSETASEIEATYANGGSLLLSRLVSSMRINRRGVGCLSNVTLHFKAIQVFLSSSSGSPFLSEYLEAGGIPVALNSLSAIISPSDPTMSRAKYLCPSAAEMCQSAFELLRLVAVAGRPYKELLCERGVLAQVSSIMREAMNSTVNHDGRTLLLELGSGNPKYQDEVLYTILQIIPCANPVCQRMAAQITRVFMSTLSFHTSLERKPRAPSIIDRDSHYTDIVMSFVPAVVSMIRSVDLQVQYEAVELLTVLSRDFPDTIPVIIADLLPLARNPVLTKDVLVMKQEEVTKKNNEKNQSEQIISGMNEIFQDYSQIFAAANLWQASAIKALEKLLTVSGVSSAIVKQGGVYILISALLNHTNIDARDVALEALIILCKSEEVINNESDESSRSSKICKKSKVGDIARFAVTNILSVQQWDRLRVLTTTVGCSINDKKGCYARLSELYSSDKTNVVLSSSNIKSIVHNLYACRMISERNASTLVRQTGHRAKTEQRRALSIHLNPETDIQNDNNEYRDLMERLIRSSLPELMDRDFSTAGKEALNKRKKK